MAPASAPFHAPDEERASFEQGRDSLQGGTNASLDELAAHLAALQA